MNKTDWAGIALALAVVLSVGGVIIENMQKADRFAACEMRGGLMKKIDGEFQCVEARK